MVPSVFALIVLTVGLILVYFGIKQIEQALGTLTAGVTSDLTPTNTTGGTT